MESYASNEEMLAELLAGGGAYDLIQPSEYVIQGLVKENLLVPIDHSAIPNIKNIAPEFADMSFDPGNQFSIPYMAGTVGIVVNTDLVDDDIRELQRRFPGQVQKEHRRSGRCAGDRKLGIRDARDPDQRSVRRKLGQGETGPGEMLPLVKVFDSDSPKTALLNGDVALGIVWGGEGAILLNENKKFKWVVPGGRRALVRR